MATFKKFNKDKRPKRNTQSLLFKRKRFCRFTVAGVEEIDYKDMSTPCAISSPKTARSSPHA
jgi:small subunit ribosomal protein S18